MCWHGWFLFCCSPVQFSSVTQSCLTLRPHELQHARPPCSSPTPAVHSDSCPLSRWCHPAISSSVITFSFWPQSLQASESFPINQLFAWGGQSTGVSALASFFPKNTQGWSRNMLMILFQVPCVRNMIFQMRTTDNCPNWENAWKWNTDSKNSLIVLYCQNPRHLLETGSRLQGWIIVVPVNSVVVT